MAFRTIDFLPEIFQTPVNRQFLSATLDQLTQEPKFKKTQGYVGRRVGFGVNPNDKYVIELDKTRADYQLEPAVISLAADRAQVKDAITYPGMIDALRNQNAITDRADRLWTSEYYSWDSFVEFDKFVNFSQYYWLPNGPDAVDVGSTSIPLTDNFTVDRTNLGYDFSGLAGLNPTIYLLRGGSYTFQVNQTPYKFWIQLEPGVDGRLAATPNISSRDILGVTNNGDELGTITFDVPLANAQQFYYDLPLAGDVDLVSTEISYADINNVYLNDFLENYPMGIDGITSLDSRTIIFTGDTGWFVTTRFDPLIQNPVNNGLPGSYDSLLFDQTTEIPLGDRYNVWRIVYNYDLDGQIFLTVEPSQTISNLQKLDVKFGTQWSNTQWYKNASGFFEKIPLLSAIFDTLYYQDSSNPEFFGVIQLLTQDQIDTLFIDNIIGKKNYTSPNGVVFTNNLKVVFRGAVDPISYQNNEYYVCGVGSAITLIPVADFVTPETYSRSTTQPYDSLPYDDGPFDGSVNVLLDPDYLVMSLNCPTRNAWSRANRWFHVDVINATAEYNNTVPVLDNEFRAKRPILEFRGGLKLFNMGTEAKQPVDIIDFHTVDAFSTVNGATSYVVDGYTFVEGTRVIFAADTDTQVRDKIYTVSFIEPSPDSSVEVILLTPATDSTVQINNTVLSLQGATQKGLTYWFDGLEYVLAQQKTAVNQAPLFDVFDLNGISFGNPAVYNSTTFTGSKIFSYALGSGLDDVVLGFPLTYLTINNVGDIVFDNNFYTQTFNYLKDNNSVSLGISNGVLREYSTRTLFEKRIGWQTAETKSLIYQQFQFRYSANTPLILDVAVSDRQDVPVLKIYVDNQYQVPGSYSFTTTANSTEITLLDVTNFEVGSVIEVLALSDQISAVGFYQIPNNLENNPFNENSDIFTLGTIRQHYQTIAESLVNFSGKINGANNTRDLGNLIPYGLIINQQSSPLTLMGYFLRSKLFNVFAAMEYNSREYEKIKAQILNAAVNTDYTNQTIPDILNDIITGLGTGKTDKNPFYWSDMLPFSNVYTEVEYVYSVTSTNTFDTNRIYDYTSSNYYALIVYVNGVQLIRNVDYTVGVNTPTITITSTLNIGDTISLREYETTVGSYVPNTPTKMGLYPAYKPEIFLDETYIEPTTVIRGHDGSITIAFEDFRDQLLLEFEKRIYNNIKMDGNPIPLSVTDVVPGQFRTTDWTLKEINDILAPDFFSWVGWNKLDFKTQNYLGNNQFSYNYSQSQNKLSQQALGIGNWRGVYNYFYDTYYVNTRPWEMLGFGTQPSWWVAEYGPAPYTSGNLVLWDDLAQGLVRDPNGSYVLPQYVRPGLTDVIPTGSEGSLLSPLSSVVSSYSQTSFRKSWIFGDDGPVENAWRTSSSYAFSVMRLLSLTRPAEFFALFANRDLYKFDSEFQQYLYDSRFRLNANGVQIYGNGVSCASYINWIVDYCRQSGIDATSTLTTDLASLDVRLSWRVGSFTAKNLLQVYTDRASPRSTNASLLLPDESYNLLLYKNVPFDRAIYSSVIVQKTQNGYALFGYGTAKPYFTISASIESGVPAVISAGGLSVSVNTQHSNDTILIPYGFEYSSISGVADFLISYGHHLEKIGFKFTGYENGYVLNWQQMVQEFLYWDAQGWGINSIINLNPCATKLEFSRPFTIMDNIAVQTQENLVLDQNKNPLEVKNLIVERNLNDFKIQPTNNQTINYFNIDLTNYENIVILDNRSIFADLIYDPTTGARQDRVRVVAVTSLDWYGQLDVPGFILNENNVLEWQPLKKYTKGQIVKYKGYYYSAKQIVQPSDKFNYNQWTRSDYTQIQTGLLPNLPNKSNQLANSYDTYSANLERDQDLFSYGLIGFRPRQYMTALNLDDVSQVNLYKQFLKTKGTITSAEIFSFADLGRGIAQFDIYENWGILKSTYGANANRSFIELQLNEALVTANPSTVEIINPQQPSSANQAIQFNQIWKSSYKITDPQIFTTIENLPTDVGLPSAGFANFEDVDFTVFDLTNPLVLGPVLDDLDVSKTIWVAKVNNYDWDVYRIYSIPGSIIALQDNLDGTSLLTFSDQHQLIKDQFLIVKYFDPQVNGVYRILSVPSPTTAIIAFVFVNVNQTLLTGQGIGFSLQSVLVDQAADIAGLKDIDEFLPGSKVWISNTPSGPWQVLEKQTILGTSQNLTATVPEENTEFGVSVAQSKNLFFALIGSPGYNSAGAVYFFVKNNFGDYIQSNILEPTTTGTLDYGRSISVGGNIFSAVGAPDSNSPATSGLGFVFVMARSNTTNVVEFSQILLPELDLATPSEFGHSVVVSKDERWIYVGAPLINAVYAFGQVPVQDQQIRYRTDGSTDAFNYDDHVVIDSTKPDQLLVILNNQLQTTADYSLVDGQVVFNSTPADDLLLIISRRNTYEFNGNGGTTYGIGNYLYTATNIDAFSVTVNDILLRPTLDYTFNTVTKQIIFLTSKSSGDQILVNSHTYYKFVQKITPPVPVAGARFGHSLDTTDDGSRLFVGAKNDTANSVSTAGAAYVYERTKQNFQVSDDTATEFSTSINFTQPLTVSINGQIIDIDSENIGGQYSLVDSNTIDISADLQVGDFVQISVNSFNFIQKITAQTPVSDEEYGYSTKICPNSCSLYIGAPGNSEVVPQTGSVDRYVNQSINYHTITATIANPSLTSGNSILINNFNITVPGVWSSSSTYPFGSVVTNLSGGVYGIYQALQAVPVSVAITDSDYWKLVSQTTFAAALNLIALTAQINASVPNVKASLSDNIEIVPTGLEKTYFIGNAYQGLTSYTPLIYQDNVLLTLNVDYTIDLSAKTVRFTSAPPSSANIVIVTGVMTLSTINTQANLFRDLTVGPGLNNPAVVINSLGLVNFVYTQTLTSPRPELGVRFGQSLAIDSSAELVAIGAPRDNAYQTMLFDNGTTYFDGNATAFYSQPTQSGAVYIYNLLQNQTSSLTNPDLVIYGQQLYPRGLNELDAFGTALNFSSNYLLASSPGNDGDDSVLSEKNYGKVTAFINSNNLRPWQVIRQQTPVVDIKLINGSYIYDRINSSRTTFFDYIDPLQGKILGAARQNIDYIGAIDPARYNVGPINNFGKKWNNTQVGQTWWDTSQVRFVNPNQNDINYASAQWGQVFPGSQVEIYQWTVSEVPPAQYTGPGIPKSLGSFTAINRVNASGVVQTLYYFWTRGNNVLGSNTGKTLPTTIVERYIQFPQSTGIPYLAFINSSTVAMYNFSGLVNAQDSILSLEYDRQYTDNAVHTEYELVPQDRADGFLSDILYRKLQDSFCGADLAGNPVPDPTLRPANRIGVSIRPRQSMFVDRFAALENYLNQVNEVCAQFPISEIRSFNLLNSAEPPPSAGSGQWDFEVADLAELSYQDFNLVPVGYTYLVLKNSQENDFWTINAVTADKTFETLQLVRVQSYDTSRYWQYINWYKPGHNSSIIPVAEVPNFAGLEALNVPINSSVKVTANAQGLYEIYLYTSVGWERVGLQNGTIEFKRELWDYQYGRFGFDDQSFDTQYFDQEPVTETRKIIQAINQEILIDDLLIERNRALVLMFNFILSETLAPDWLTKTSLIDVDHRIRQLLPYENYQRDNQEFVIDYIQEVKPYHVQVREFNLIYNGFDIYQGSLTDYDLPAYFDTALTVPKFVSPILTPYDLSTAVGTGRANTDSDTSPTDTLWTQQPYDFWFENYKLSVQSVSIVSGGSGYVIPPTVTITGTCTVPAVLTAQINSLGQVSAITVVDPGSGYLTTPSISISGTGSGAKAVAVMGNGLVREISTTIKFDRYQYSSNITDWAAGVTYVTGQRVRYRNRVWQAIQNNTSSTFEISNWSAVSAGSLSGVDRTQGFYTPTSSQFGRDLNLLISGLDYPGVQVYGLMFGDNVSVLDAIYESSFLDAYLGTRTSDINVEGGAFVDQYSSYAPEELVPGSIFDTLDLRTYTRPGADWEGDGHGFPIAFTRFIYNSSTNTSVSFEDIAANPVQIIVSNQTQQRDLIIDVHYTIDWVNQIVTILDNISFPAAANGDCLVVALYGLGGGNQLYRKAYYGTISGTTVTIPVLFSEITDTVVWINGSENTTYSIAEDGLGFTQFTFSMVLSSTDYVNITAFGSSSYATGVTWSTPVIEYFTADGSTLDFPLSADMSGTNAATAIVERNGIRARPPAGASLLADGSTAFPLPTRLGFSQSAIADSDVVVWLNNELQVQGVDYVVEPYVSDEDLREVIFVTEPQSGDRIYIAVFTDADYTFSGLGTSSVTLQWNPTSGFLPLFDDIITVITWNDTQQQNLITTVYVGPDITTVGIDEPYDSTVYDLGTVSGDPGSYDFAGGLIITVNNLQLNQVYTKPERLWVTLNGDRLFYGSGFTISGTELVLSSGVIGTLDVVVITEMTDSITPEAMAFRIFQDMRGLQLTYRITDQTSTELAQDLDINDSTIYVVDASNLAEPDPSQNILGVITVNGERITYRIRNINDNSLSGLRRGTAGTAVANHAINSAVYDMGIGNLLSEQYQDHAVRSIFFGDGSTSRYTAANINLSYYADSSGFIEDAVRVYVGGQRQTGNYFISHYDPLRVDFDEPPPDGQEIVIEIIQGLSWYQPGTNTASDGQALQVTETFAARFLRGQI